MTVDQGSTAVNEFLEHFGTKGMKWGVRKQNRLVRAKKVSSGKASYKEHVLYNLTDKSYKPVFTRAQYRNQASKKVKELETVKKTVLRGDAGVKEFLKLYGRQAIWAARVVAPLAFSDEDGEFLEHFGVRGMKWGIRNSRSSSVSDGPSPINRRTARADKKFEKVAISRKNRVVGRQLLQDAAKNANDEILVINKKYSRNEHQLVDGVPAGSKKYYDEVYSVLNKHLDALSGFHENASNTRRWKLSLEVDDMGVERLRSRTEEIEHSSMEGWVDLPYTKDSNGLITNVEFPEELLDLLDENLEQDAMAVTDFLEHHGIKGMKWGVRRKRSSRREFASTISKPADVDSEDGKSTRQILAKQKKHGTVALTNHELRTINARQKLEQEFIKANPKEKGKLDRGHDQVQRYLKMGMTAKQAYDLLNSPAGKALRGKGANQAAQVAAQKAAQKAVWQMMVGKPLGFNN